MKSAEEIKKDLEQMKLETGFDINTREGARAYLRSEGIDPDEESRKGIAELKKLGIYIKK